MPPPAPPDSLSQDIGISMQYPNLSSTLWLVRSLNSNNQFVVKASMYPNVEVLGTAIGGSVMYRRTMINNESSYGGWELDLSLASARLGGVFAKRFSFGQVYIIPSLLGAMGNTWGLYLPVGISLWTQKHWGLHMEYNHLLILSHGTNWNLDSFPNLSVGLSYRY